MGREVEHRLVVKLHGANVEVAPLQQWPRQRSCSWTNLQHIGAALVLGDAFGDASGGIKVLEEMLAEVFFGTNAHG